MIPIKEIRNDSDRIFQGAIQKGEEIEIKKILNLDKELRLLIKQTENNKAERNSISQEIAKMKFENNNPTNLIADMKILSSKIKTSDVRISKLKEKLNTLLKWIPNIPHDSVPIGKDERANEVVRYGGRLPEKNFKIQNHTQLADSLGLIDFSRGAKISGSGFPLYTKQGARLERALINFMLNHNIKRNYTEILTPFLTLSKSMETTGQIPKLAEDMYHVEKDGLYLIPTAEVPLTNIHREEILQELELPIKYTAYSPCFRREAGSYGKDTRGLLRIHQFNKVEMVKFVKPDDSYMELELLTEDAESILQALGLHYRVVCLCTGDLSFAAAKCYDLEVWAPGEKRWLEVSSCSNFESFQARRGNIRYRDENGLVQFLHTLNGSGLATPRLMIGILESFQDKQGKVKIPSVLQPYFGGEVLQ
ncbi:MAG: serine--tRNA ligase [Candidatus Marinimicrobia bacterium]|nr:serine--tRNA ligase [Candidatus Neomarinimicrobiota bacterium]|tara:strand:- start:2427 stop:3689 length:1263 start_codon:yes stop_codon:yes gene_type:complete